MPGAALWTGGGGRGQAQVMLGPVRPHLPMSGMLIAKRQTTVPAPSHAREATLQPEPKTIARVTL